MVDFEHALKTYRLASRMLSEVLSSCELMDNGCMERINDLGLRNPLTSYPFYMLVEVSGSQPVHDELKLNSFLESAMGEGIVSDGTVTSEPSRIQVTETLYSYFKNILIRLKRKIYFLIDDNKKSVFQNSILSIIRKNCFKKDYIRSSFVV